MAQGRSAKWENTCVVLNVQSNCRVAMPKDARVTIDQPYLKCDVAQKERKEYHIGH